MHADGRRLNFRAATSGVPWANPVCPWLGVALQRKARANETLAHGTRIGCFCNAPLSSTRGAATLVLVFLAAIASCSATADDLITAAEVQWQIESLGLDDDAAARVQHAAERANVEAADLAAVRSEWVEWHRSLSHANYSRRLSLIPNGIGVYYFEYQNTAIAHEAINSRMLDDYFDTVVEIAASPAEAEVLRNAHTVAHFSDANNIRQEKLRDLVANVMPEDADQRAPIEAALAQHEKNLAAIYREWKEAERADVRDRVAAWAKRDFEAYLNASMRSYMLRTDARDEIRRAGTQILAMLSGEARTMLNRDFRRMLYPPTLSNLMDEFNKAMARADLPDGARAALLNRRERFYEEYDRILEERMEIHEGFYDREVVRLMMEAGARNSFYGEPVPPEAGAASQERMERMQEWAKQDRVFSTDVVAILREHGAIDPNERLAVMSAPLAADVPAETDPTWRFYYGEPVISRPDLERLLDGCAAISDERTLARAMYDEYRTHCHDKAIELGVTVTVLDEKREEFKRENPDAPHLSDWNLVSNEYGRLDSKWAVALTDFDLALWRDISLLFDDSRRSIVDRAIFDAQWERLNQKLRSGNMGGNERHLLAVVDEAFADSDVPAECQPILSQYRDEVLVVTPDVRRRLETLEVAMSEARERRQAEGGAPDEGPSREYEEWVALFQKPGEVNAKYRDLLLAAANEEDRNILQRAFDKEVHPELFVTSPIDLLARELEEIEAGGRGGVDRDRFDAARSILDTARAQYDRNTRAMMAAKAEWSGPNAEAKWTRWQEDHPPPDPARPHLDREGPMDHLWDQRRDIAKSACAQAARLFPPQERSTLPAGLQLLLMWPEER